MSINCCSVSYKYCALNAGLCSRSAGNSFDQIEPCQLCGPTGADAAKEALPSANQPETQHVCIYFVLLAACTD